MRLRYALLVCAGCDAVFGLHDVPPIDATHGAGSDAAGTACPAHPHAIVIDGSGDLDHDGLDNCHDPCPLNPGSVASYGSDSDGDGLPDFCDPNPTGGTTFPDCVVVLDDFSDGNQVLDPRWMSASSAGPHWQWSSQDCVSGTLGFCSPGSAAEGVLYLDDVLVPFDFVAAQVAVYDPGASYVAQVMPDTTPDGSDLDGRACGYRGPTIEANIDDVTAGSSQRVGQGDNGNKYGAGDAIFLDVRPDASWQCGVQSCDDGSAACNAAGSAIATPQPTPQHGNLGLRFEGGGELEVRWVAAFASGSACE